MVQRMVSDYEVIDHGPEWEDYFQGCGVSFSEFTDVATGIGDSRFEAYEDAVEQLATGGWDTDSLPSGKEAITRDVGPDAKLTRQQRASDGCHWYVSVRVR